MKRMVQRSTWKLLPILTSVLVSITIFSNIRNAWSLEGKREDDESITSILLSNISCQNLFDGEEQEAAMAKMLQVNSSSIIDAILDSSDSCNTIEKLFRFFPTLSAEENDFPIAYAMLVHKDVIQVMMLLSALYQLQNQFCIAVDGNSNERFWNVLRKLASCYSNIQIFRVKKIEWCSFGIIEAVFDCVVRLANSTLQWNYIQILSGVDAPLKTNLESVRILKALNGSFNTEILPFERYRLHGKRAKRSPLPLVKSSMSVVFSREAANFMVANQVVHEQLTFLKGTICPDESFWATIAGNPHKLAMPGGFDAKEFLRRKFGKNYAKWWFRANVGPWITPPNTSKIELQEQKPFLDNYVISRYQQWQIRPNSRCRGRYYRLSCIFGVDDLPILVRRHELVAHKLYIDFQPAAFLCLIREIRQRSLHPVQFDANIYKNLPDGPI
ncbi:unnamed protein product [Cylicocyclus nassatus]|uniref:Uncharacterized protein n=1 Tax=Cylicocyclus nassatus TaxID=53992 RepID=A0AA36DT82_CYLNA|nr:unnamed protein product [Cylicocyclus nassatus]